MSENLLTGSAVCLFGRVMTDLELVKDAGWSKPRGQNVLAQALAAPDARLARIYAFSFESEVMVLTKPAAFLVHGEGEAIDKERCLLPDGLTLPTDLQAWVYDRADMTLRLDILTGTFDSLLLDYELGGGGLQDYVRGGRQAGTPSPMGPGTRGGRGRRWRSDDD